MPRGGNNMDKMPMYRREFDTSCRICNVECQYELCDRCEDDLHWGYVCSYFVGISSDNQMQPPRHFHARLLVDEVARSKALCNAEPSKGNHTSDWFPDYRDTRMPTCPDCLERTMALIEEVEKKEAEERRLAKS